MGDASRIGPAVRAMPNTYWHDLGLRGPTYHWHSTPRWMTNRLVRIRMQVVWEARGEPRAYPIG